MSTIRAILHPTDFSECSRAAFEFARSLARDHGARLVLLYVGRPPLVDPLMAEVPAEPDERAAADALARLRDEAPDVEVERRVLTEDDPADAIIRCAGEAKCDLIVMGTHGRTALGRALLGSVAEKVTRQARCPVMTVKALPRREPVPEESAAGAGPKGSSVIIF